MEVFFYEAFKEEERELRKFLPENIKSGFTWKTIQESGHSVPPAKLISTRTQSNFPVEWNNELTGILSRSTGYEHLLEYRKITQSCIQLGYLPLYCHRAVAEHAMMLWMSLLRKLNQQQINFNTFHRDEITGYECENKILLIVGVGNIGGQLIKIGKGLGMKIICVDIDKKYADENYLSIEEGLSNADIVVCSMNLTEKNRNYFNYDLLKKAKRNLIFINISRGELSPSSDLLRLIEENHLGGVGLDVFNYEKELVSVLRENKTSHNPEVLATLELIKKPNVIFTPHNAFNSYEAIERKASQSIEQVVNFLNTGKFKWNVTDF